MNMASILSCQPEATSHPGHIDGGNRDDKDRRALALGASPPADLGAAIGVIARVTAAVYLPYWAAR
ncbi:MAG: hypothetical protein Q8Q19_04490 [Microbacterium sp.]|nr:hypothetical protein [Microbacterium sp.]